MLIQAAYPNHDIEIGADKGGNLTLRFGYWKAIDTTQLNKILYTDNLEAEISLVDDDPECGDLYNYTIKNRYDNANC
jgi:hypothetical protein